MNRTIYCKRFIRDTRHGGDWEAEGLLWMVTPSSVYRTGYYWKDDGTFYNALSDAGEYICAPSPVDGTQLKYVRVNLR